MFDQNKDMYLYTLVEVYVCTLNHRFIIQTEKCTKAHGHCWRCIPLVNRTAIKEF